MTSVPQQAYKLLLMSQNVVVPNIIHQHLLLFNTFLCLKHQSCLSVIFIFSQWSNTVKVETTAIIHISLSSIQLQSPKFSLLVTNHCNVGNIGAQFWREWFPIDVPGGNTYTINCIEIALELRLAKVIWGICNVPYVVTLIAGCKAMSTNRNGLTCWTKEYVRFKI